MSDVQVWSLPGVEGSPVHAATGTIYGQSWCGKRAQFRHRVYNAPEADITCKTCLRRLAYGSPLSYRAR